MIQGKWFAPGQDISDEVLPVRACVFGGSSWESTDPEGWNALVYSDGCPVAAGRIWWQDDVFWLGYIGVLEGYRGQHLGDLVLRLLLFKAQSHAAREVRLICPDRTESFFSRLGFKSVRHENGLSEMMIPGNMISLDSCAACKKKNCPNRK